MARETTFARLQAQVGQTLSTSEWIEISQERVNRFAACTDDRQFIHVDPAAARKTPLGGPIAHGFLTLSLLSAYGPRDMPQLDGLAMTINYGLNKVRFVHPVRIGARIRFHTKILAVTEKSPGRFLITAEKTAEIEGEDKPAMVAETLSLAVLEGSGAE